MTGTTLRLGAGLAGALLVGLALVDAAFLFHSQARIGRERRAEMRLALNDARASLTASGDARLRLALADVAARYEVQVSLVGAHGLVQTHAVVLPSALREGGAQLEGGYEHVATKVAGVEAWQWLVVSRPLADSTTRALALQRSALGVLAFAGALTLALALFFLRTSVQRPLARLTALVGRHDRAALTELGRDDRHDLGRLSHAIIAMVQAAEDDRRRIAWQLAELQAAHQELEAAQQRLVRSERLAVTGQLAAGLAHEIGNPLAILSGYVELLQAGALSGAELSDTLGRMARELGRIHTTVRSLLDLSRAPPQAPGVGEVGDAVEHVRALMVPQKKLRDIQLTWPQLSEPISVCVDTQAIVQLLVNLLLNAADALEGKGRIAVSADTNDLVATLTVEDSGPGIPEPLRAKVFEPFFTTKPAGAGTGLGLTVCERIVSAAGGDITVATSHLGGALVRVTLPMVGVRSSLV